MAEPKPAGDERPDPALRASTPEEPDRGERPGPATIRITPSGAAAEGAPTARPSPAAPAAASASAPAANPAEPAARAAAGEPDDRPASWQVPSVHPEGRVFVLVPAVAAFLSALVGWTGLGVLLLLAAAFIAYFFRDPERVPPLEPGLLVAPGDGLITRIVDVDLPRHLLGDGGLAPGRATRISIFLSVFDVHVNRTPLAGTVRRMVYVPGAFVNASLDKASEENERQYLVVEGEDGTRVGLVLIAGLVARRIVRFVGIGDRLAPGARIGLIRFGSRVDLFLPQGFVPSVRVGQRAVGGETVLARRSSS